MKRLQLALAFALLAFACPAMSDRSSKPAFDLSPFQPYLQYVGGSGDVPGAILAGGNVMIGEMPWAHVDPKWLANPQGLFDIGFNQGNQRSLNPYYSTANRDDLRGVAAKLGLPADAADRAALEFAQAHFQTHGHGYTEVSSSAAIKDEIAARIRAAAGKRR